MTHATKATGKRGTPRPSRSGWRVSLLGALLAAAGTTAFGVPPLLRSSYRNPVWPDSAITSNAWWPAYTNTVGFAAIGGFTATNRAGPSTGNLVLAESSFAEPIVGVGANFQLGDALTPPVGVNSNVTPVLDFMGGPTNAVWINYEGLLIASDMGALQVDWTLQNGSTQTIVYTISPNPTRRPVRLYWTEGQNSGPTIAFGSTYRVDIFYNSQVRGTNQVWIDANQLHASPDCPSGSRFLLTYSRVDEGTGKRVLLAYEIVEVLEPMSSVRSAFVGERLLPMERPYPTDSLFATITRGVVDPAGIETPYVYQHSDGNKSGWVWAIRETPVGEPWRIEIYWKAKEELDILWPFEVDIYDITWGTNAQLYVRGAAGEADPRTFFHNELQVELMPHTKPENHHAVLDNGVFYTKDAGYCLLKYTANKEVWFEPVRSVLCTDPLLAGNPVAWVIPDELRPVDAAGDSLEDTHGDWPGFIYTNAGTAYNIGMYHYPSAYSAPDAADSYAFPVNIGRLDVWWSNASRQEGLPGPVYFPSHISRYDSDWPTDPLDITIASELGNRGYTEDRDSWCIRFDKGDLPLEEAQLLACHLDLANPNNLDLAGQFTLELWVKPASLDGIHYLIDKGGNYSLRLNGGVPELYAGGGWYRAGSALTTNWQHLAVSAADFGSVSFLLNGQEIGSAAFAGRITPGNAHFRIGARASDGVTPEDFFAGSMDEVRIWAVVRSKETLRALMGIDVDAGTPGLRAHYRFRSEDRALDSSNFGNHIPLPAAGVQFAEPGVPNARTGLDLSGVDFGLYVQNDRATHGFNPNEEHAIVFQDTVYALRCDLNNTNRSLTTYTSDPFVLVNCRSPLVAGNRPSMMAFHVIASNSIYGFQRFLTAGLMIQPPTPIALMYPSNCESNQQVAGPVFRDRNLYYWAKQAGDTGGTTNYVFDYFYPMQEDFFFPDLAVQPPSGTQIPWLNKLTANHTPLDFTYIVEWPADLPVLHIGDTLTVARDGLPAIRGQLSVDLLYMQSAARNPAKPSVTLIDPTVARTGPLDDAKLVTERMDSYRDVRTARWHFNGLPPALRSRLFYNPNASEGEELQLIGEYRTRTDNHNYLMLNLLTGANRAATTNETAMTGITGEGGDSWREGIGALPTIALEITTNTAPFDSLALPTTGLGTGYVTVVFNNSPDQNMVDPSEVIDMAIFRVSPELYRGRLDAILSENPLDKQMSVYYTADFRGTPERWEFQWEYADPRDGAAPDENEDSLWHDYVDGAGLHYVTIGDAGVFGLSDHYLRCRYRALDPEVIDVVGADWSAWTPPLLCEGWIKRVLKAINPFEQRIRDFMNYAVLTDLSMIQQIGAPYDGDIPLNYEALNEFGLLQIYETLNHQADDLSLNAGYEASGSLALALLMVKGRISDLYMLLGHEAYSDALNPTLYLNEGDPVNAGESSSLFCFMNQEPDLLAEELALLRGRDDDMSPAVTEYPVYNRLAWNITADIVGGQVPYMLNYGISDLKGNQNGVLDAEDATTLFPQGHGDAYGHYLSALTGYYDYLHTTNFVWFPQVEGILVGDTEVTVSYLHEKRFAIAAAARARAGVAVIADTHRQAYDGGEGWRTARDSNTNRAWGVGDWGSRVGMGAYFDWLTGNSLLPHHDEDPSHDGIRVIDRENVPELGELADLGNQAQRQTDYADAGLNPLGLDEDAVPFDISSAGIDEGQTHFEQIYARALKALQNALAVQVRVRNCSQAIRDQNESADLDASIQAEETRINRELIETYGYPYANDIGPGKIYEQGYAGPDLLHYLYVDTWPLDSTITTDQRKMQIPFTMYQYKTGTNTVELDAVQSFVSEWFAGALDTKTFDIVSAYYDSSLTRTVEVNVANNGVPIKPASYTGKRRAEGEIQIAMSEYLTAIDDLYSIIGDAQLAADDLNRQGQLFLTTLNYMATKLNETVDAKNKMTYLNGAIKALDAILELAKAVGEMTSQIKEASVESLPTCVGLSTDATAPARGAIKFTYASVSVPKLLAGIAIKATAAVLQMRVTDIQNDLERTLLAEDILYEGQKARAELLSLLQKQNNYLSTIQAELQRTETARMRLQAAISKGDQLQIERERLRMNWAADLNTRRYRNMAYRLFLNDELVRYQQSFDLAARYAYLAAKAYDYETGLLESDAENTAGREFMKQIVRTRSLGRFADWTQAALGEPLVGGPTGDPGLADAMARMAGNWDVLKGRLNFNNPQQETGRFSLRQELFRISPDTASDANWKATLAACKVANLRDLPAFARYCLPFDPMQDTEPAIVIPFSTAIDFRRNFFGHLLAGGDNAYDSSHFSTKIRGAGVWFSNFDAAFGEGLANQPRVYLIPVGVDSMRVPLGSDSKTRQWSIVDQALPIPYPITDAEWGEPDWSQLKNVLGNDLYRIRQFPSMLAYHDSGDDDANLLQMTWNSRLIGRSVWNSQWILIIPGGTLLSDADEGIERFINGRLLPSGARDGNGVRDIKLYFQTYSYSGN